MAVAVGVVFSRGGKVYSFDPGGLDLAWNEKVVCQTSRGQEFGRVVQANHELPDEGPSQSGDADVVPAHVVADLEQQLADTRERLVRVRSARDRARRERDRARAEAASSAPARDGTGLVGRLSRRLRP